MGGQVGSALACYGSFLSSKFESRHLLKIENGRHKQRSIQHTLARQIKILKIRESEHVFVFVFKPGAGP
jgi:hypothetical protein